MTDQPYDHQGHQGPEGYDPYAQQHPRPTRQPRQEWPGQQQGQRGQAYEDPQAHLQHTQQWQGQTWETSVQPPVAPADPAATAYLPPQTGETPNHGAPQQAYGAPQQAYGDPQQAYGHQQAGHGSQQSGHGSRQDAYGSQQAGHGSQQAAYGSQQAALGHEPAAYDLRHSAYGGPSGHGGPSGYGATSGYGDAPAHGGPGVSAAPLPPENPAQAGHWQSPAQDHAQAANRQAPTPRTAHRPTASAPSAPSAHAPAGTPAHTPDQDTGSTGMSYGPATLAGNARVTDAQRARLEGRSPIIEPGMQPAALTAVLGLLLSGAAAVGSYALLVPLVVLQAVTAAGWFRLNGMWPARQGIALAFLGALVSDAALLVAGRENAPAAIFGTLGVWVLLCLVLQLRSHADPDERMYGLMATVASSALAVLATGHLGAEPDAVTVGAAAVAVAVLARALPLPTPASVVVALLAAAGAGIAVGGMTGMGAKGALLGAGAAVCALVGHRVASYDYPSRFVHFTAGVALPLAAAAPAVYVLGRALA
ncbi:hypothetical protein [Streptomyces asoensis]|uniref:hypothetical protein n=1 Tax=Streptomyces asoensis TaxID=249586 RepID=UPI003409D8B5